jgi:Molecular chaperone GrpE (heat shock protein)
MSEKKKKKDEKQEEELITETTCDTEGCECEENTESSVVPKEEYDKLEAKINELNKKCDEYFDKIQRAAAEFDNFKKRTIKEKEALYTEAYADAIQAFLPVVDNMERAASAFGGEGSDVRTLKEGLDMVYKQLGDAFAKLGVEEIKAAGKPFDPEIHNAVMHIDDESFGENQIVEVFQKGYKLKDKVLRHSMVKVAN